ncbi:HD domain-containing protein [Hahella sp. HN01]|uniref:HD domain-containing protein n=1 Tax=Hahella sp. HN01 TaxID=2847262 RepID=UPI0020A62C88|nr:HD domain-containing protein [Hahella sp. HN01]
MDKFLYDLLGVRDRLIMDPVHGAITLFEHEVRVIDHPLFQRLRHICQNDILSLVFPGATHSRFLHSIGVMHVGHKMFRGLMESCMRRHRMTQESSSLPLASIDFFNKLTRLACLLHDCGHSSFSHQFSKVPSIAAMLGTSEPFQRLWAQAHVSDKDMAALYPAPPDKLEHEHYSVRCAWEILHSQNDEKSPFSALDVSALMETTAGAVTPEFARHAELIWPLLSGSTETPEQPERHIVRLLRLIVSGEIDADRADYMLRDGFHSSVTIGGFNLDHLLKNLHVGWDPEFDWMGLAITPKGLGALEDFVYSRHQMYRKVYGHKTSIGFDWLLRQAMEEVIGQPDVGEYVRSCLTDINEFCYLTDNYFWEQFRLLARKQPKSYSQMMINRVRPHHLHTQESTETIDQESIKAMLAERHDLKPEQVVCCALKARFSKIKGAYEDIKVMQKPSDPERTRPQYVRIGEVSNFFHKFEDETIAHFYRKP